MSTTAIVLTEDGEFVPGTFETPAAAPGGAVLEVEMTGLCGTDVKIRHGRTSSARPLIMGHEILGRLVDVSPDLARTAGVHEGQRVILNAMVPCWACPRCWSGEYRLCPHRFIYGVDRSTEVAPHLWGGFAEHVVVAPGSLLHPLSEDVPAKAAVLLGVIANGFDWAVRVGEIAPGSIVLVQGAGPQGIACAIAAREAGAEAIVLTGLGRDAERLRLARELAGAVTVDVSVDDPVEALREASGGSLADTVVDVSGAPAAFDTNVAALIDGGRLVMAGLSGEDETTAVHMDRLVWKDITLRAAISKKPESFERATTLLESGRYDVGRLVTHVWGIEEAATALDSLESTDPDALPIKAALAPTRGATA